MADPSSPITSNCKRKELHGSESTTAPTRLPLPHCHDPPPPRTSLLSLPTELLVEIVQYVPYQTQLRICFVSKRLNSIAAKFLYSHLPLGYYGAYDDVDRVPASPFSTLKVLKSILNPHLASYVQFIDHVDHPLPTWTMTTHVRAERLRAVPPGAPVIGMQNAFVHRQPPPKALVHELESVLSLAMSHIRTQALNLHTVRIVNGAEKLVGPLLNLVLDRNSVRKLWLEEIRLRSLAVFLDSRPEPQPEGWRTGLTHLRLRKLKATKDEDPEQEWDPKNDPHFSSISRFMRIVLPASPNLTSIALDAVHDLAPLPAILNQCTFPSLTAFQLRTQTEDKCVVPFYLTEPRLLSFLLRHSSKLTAFAWPAENFIRYESEKSKLVPLLSVLSRTLTWFRTDCSLLSPLTFEDESRYDGSPRDSRIYIATFLHNLNVLETFKLQGDFQPDELNAYWEALAAHGTLKKLSLIRGMITASTIANLVRAIPEIQILKLCSYFSPGLVAFYDSADLQTPGGEANTPFRDFLGLLRPLHHLHTLTIPLHSGLDISDSVVSDIWDKYRADRAYKTKAVSLTTEISLDDDTTLIDVNGITQHAPQGDPDAQDIAPAAVVRHAVKNVEEAGLSWLQQVRLFFILNVESENIENWNIDCHEFIVGLRQKETSNGVVHETATDENTALYENANLSEESRITTKPVKKPIKMEVRDTPTISYGWGTTLWTGVTKDLNSRAWF